MDEYEIDVINDIGAAPIILYDIAHVHNDERST